MQKPVRAELVEAPYFRLVQAQNMQDPATALTLPDPLPLDSGATLSPVTIAYERYGQLSPERDNAVLIFHALTGDQYVASPHPATGKPGWWDRMVGPDKPIDTDRYYVICANVIGGMISIYRWEGKVQHDAEAGLIAYLWPLLIVLFSGLLPGERLRLGHIVGALVSFAGAALLLSRGSGGFSAEALPGYIFAVLCALTWSSYSVLSRRLGAMPTDTVAIYCVATAVLSALAHLVVETTTWPETGIGWVSVVALGLGPVGLAFYTWDVGVKRGNIQLLGTASYAAPLLSTFVLIAFGVAQASPVLILAAALITFGAFLAARAGRSPAR